MHNVSFAWTTPALLTGHKTVTRREWDQNRGISFHYGEGEMFKAFDRNPRNGGTHVADCKVITCQRQPLREMPDSDYELEGFAYLYDQVRRRLRGESCDPGIDHIRSDELATTIDRTSPDGFRKWRMQGGFVWVLRFEVLSIVADIEKAREEQRQLENRQNTRVDTGTT